MRVVVTSDFHGTLPVDGSVPPCDLLLVVGDVLGNRGGGTFSRSRPPWLALLGEWLERQPAETIIGVAGNHDYIAVSDPDAVRALPWMYLENEAAVVDGVTVFGSPLSMPFGGWEFMAPEHDLRNVWETIPPETQILAVHGPAAGVLDKTRGGITTGSRTLLERVKQLPELKLLVTGHIHEAYGETAIPRANPFDPFGCGAPDWVRAVNASYMNEMYRPGNPPIVVDL